MDLDRCCNDTPSFCDSGSYVSYSSSPSSSYARSERLYAETSSYRSSRASDSRRSTVSSSVKTIRRSHAATKQHDSSSSTTSAATTAQNSECEEVKQTPSTPARLVEDPDLTTVEKIIDESIGKDMCVQEPLRIGGEVLQLKTLRIRRAPSPPRPLHRRPVLLGVVGGHSGKGDSQFENNVENPATQTKGPKLRKRCGVCFRILPKKDLVDDRNVTLKRRDKKCAECWDKSIQESARPQKKKISLVRVAIEKSKRHGKKPPLQDVSHIPREMLAARASVAAILQDIAVSQAIAYDDGVQCDYWHVPFWMFDLPAIPNHLRRWVEISLERQ